MWLYASLLFFSIVVPFALSFDKKLQFYKSWKYLFPSVFAIAAVYIAFDLYFTKQGFWGFNPLYHLNILLLGLPVEEWLFFIVVPYACVFIHESLLLYFPQLKLGRNASKLLTVVLLLGAVVILVANTDKAYTTYISATVVAALALALTDRSNVIQSYYATFLVILVPFVAVNSVLTGSFIHQEVVWYNNSEILGIRFLTIPIEDFGYAFSLILFNLMATANLKNFRKHKSLQ
jgi:lycopene cyclase domain-containing protein